MPQHNNQPENKRVRGEVVVQRDLCTSVDKRRWHDKRRRRMVEQRGLAVAVAVAIAIAVAVTVAVAVAIAVVVAIS